MIRMVNMERESDTLKSEYKEAFSSFCIGTGILPAGEGRASEFLSPPIFPGLTEQELLHL